MIREAPLDLAAAADRLVGGTVTGVGDVERERRARRGSATHETCDEALAELMALVPVLLDSAPEARRLTLGRRDPNPSP